MFEGGEALTSSWACISYLVLPRPYFARPCGSMISLLLQILTTWALLISLALGSVCYNPDGSVQETNSTSKLLKRWNTYRWDYMPYGQFKKCLGDTKACCSSEYSLCMEGGWCFDPWFFQMYRGGCTDKNWSPGSGCASHCLAGK